MPILITVSGRDVDVRVALVNADGTAGPFADAPNRRMGIETLLVESPHDNALSLRIERNDQPEARGTVTVDAVALPARERSRPAATGGGQARSESEPEFRRRDEG